MADLFSTLQTIQSRIKCTKTGSGYQAKCPCHDDSSPSLSITVKDDIILLHCHAGCPFAQIVSALGLQISDLFADHHQSSGYRRNGGAIPPRPQTQDPVEPPPDYGPLLAAARAHPFHFQRLLELADSLGALPESREAWARIADSLGIVWLGRCKTLDALLPNKGKGWKDCWGIPERSASGEVIGINRRYKDGSKKQMMGGRRGLVFAPEILADHDSDAPIYLPEGASDVIALMGVGLAAIGRPSNVGGTILMADILSTIKCSSVIILGENDAKEKTDPETDEKIVVHPGKDGMDRTAAFLANVLRNHTVMASLVPAPHKDSRACIAGRSGQALGVLFVAALALVYVAAGSYFPNSKVDMQGESTPLNETSGSQEGNPQESSPERALDKLPHPPAPASCPHCHTALLRHEADDQKHRSTKYACDSWGCPVCKHRLAYEWVQHLAVCTDEAILDGRILIVGESTRSQLDGPTLKRLRKHKADWAALETLPGHYLVIASLPASASIPGGFTEIGGEEAHGKLVDWALKVRAINAFSKVNKKARPVRTSRDWQLHREQAEGEWKLVSLIDTEDIDTVCKIVSDEGGRITADTTAPGERRGGTSLVWLLQWRADPETSQRITKRLRELCSEVAFGWSKKTERQEWIDPFADVSESSRFAP